MSLVRIVEKSLMEGLPVLLHFPRSSLNEWIYSEGLLPSKEDDILKQRQSLLSIRWLSASSCSDSGSLTIETAIFVKSHLKKWVLSLPRGAKNSVNPVNLVILDLLSLLSRWACARRAGSLSAFRDGIGRKFKNAPIANRRHLILKLILSLRKLERWRGSLFSVPVPLQRFSVQPTRAFLESILNVNISFCTSRNIFDRLWGRVVTRYHSSWYRGFPDIIVTGLWFGVADIWNSDITSP